MNIKEIMEASHSTTRTRTGDLFWWSPTKGITCQDIYGKPFNELFPPEGWEFTGEFRPVILEKDVALDPNRTSLNGYKVYLSLGNVPRVILRKKPKIKRTRIIFEPTGKIALLKIGEYYLFNGEVLQNLCGLANKYEILTRRDEVYEVEQD